jgi:formamidopyrimidine-DNA glycosylase
MPEGVEVKLSADLIRPLVVGKTTASFYMSGRYKSSDPEGLKEFTDKSKVLDVRTKGKFMYWSFENDWYMYCTFGMTGQWSPKKGKHPALGITFVDGSEIYFNDPRHFGTIKFVKGEANLKKKLAELGWDPLTQDISTHSDLLFRKILMSPKPIGELLMDQKIFAGVGNYIRAEALYQAKVSPWRRGLDFSKESLTDLCESCVNVMEESQSYQGATIQTYATPYGEEGKYSGLFKVYGQKQDPLGNPIKKEITPEGRTIHWCPAIQV